MNILKKINKGLIITVIVLFILIIYLANVEIKRSEEKPKIDRACEEYLELLNGYFTFPKDEEFLVLSQYTDEEKHEKEEKLKKEIENKTDSLKENLKAIMIDNEKIVDMQIRALKSDLENMNSSYTGIITLYNKKIAKIKKYEFDGEQVVVTFETNEKVEEKYKNANEIDEKTLNEKIEVRKDEKTYQSETLTLQKVGNDWKIVYAELVNNINNDEGGLQLTWKVS